MSSHIFKKDGGNSKSRVMFPVMDKSLNKGDPVCHAKIKAHKAYLVFFFLGLLGFFSFEL